MGETEEHWFLKQVGLTLLLKKGCRPAWTEIRLPIWDESPLWEYEDDGEEGALMPTEYRIVDAAGLKQMAVKGDKQWRMGLTDRFRTILAIEAKVSRSDFQHGFCTGGWGKLWILTPPGLLDTSEIPAGVGLYEFDFDSGKLAFRSPSKFSGYRPSEFALENLEKDMIWSGYGAGVTRKLDDERLKRILAPAQMKLPEAEETP